MNKNEQQWMDIYDLVKEYGVENIKTNTIYKNVKIGTWIDKQRTNYKKNKLKDYRKQLLIDIGIDFNPLETQWLDNYNLVKEYGIENIKRNTIYKDVNLGIWIQHQRMNYRNNKLEEDKKQLLIDIGIDFNPLETQWLDNYNLVKEYGVENIKSNTIYKNINLGNWIQNQRMNYKNNKLEEDKKQLLIDIGIDFNPLETQWLDNYNLVKEYGVENININTIYKNVKIGTWIDIQRINYKKNILRDDKKQLLIDIGIDFNPLETQWLDNYNLVKEYGIENIKYNTIYKNINLGNWIQYQRQKYKNNKLKDDKIQLLVDIGMKFY